MAVKEIRNGGSLDHSASIYGLADPRNGNVMYVGVTIRPLKARMREHLIAAKGKNRLPVHAWMRDLLDRGLKPIAAVLEPVPPGADWAEAEKCQISLLRSEGMAELNVRDGGNGGAGHVWTAEARAAHSETAKRRGISAQTRAKMQATKAARGYCLPPETIERMKSRVGPAAPHFGMKHSPEARARISAALTGKPTGLTGAKNPYAKAVIAEGVTYETVTAAAKALGLTQSAISRRLKKGTAQYVHPSL